MGNDTAIDFSDSEDLIYQAEYEGEEDCEVTGELARLLQQEERAIQPHEELLDTINLGTEEDKKEIKVGANLESSVKERLISYCMILLRSLPSHTKTCRDSIQTSWYTIYPQEKTVHQ